MGLSRRFMDVHKKSKTFLKPVFAALVI